MTYHYKHMASSSWTLVFATGIETTQRAATWMVNNPIQALVLLLGLYLGPQSILFLNALYILLDASEEKAMPKGLKTLGIRPTHQRVSLARDIEAAVIHFAIFPLPALPVITGLRIAGYLCPSLTRLTSDRMARYFHSQLRLNAKDGRIAARVLGHGALSFFISSEPYRFVLIPSFWGTPDTFAPTHLGDVFPDNAHQFGLELDLSSRQATVTFNGAPLSSLQEFIAGYNASITPLSAAECNRDLPTQIAVENGLPDPCPVLGEAYIMIQYAGAPYHFLDALHHLIFGHEIDYHFRSFCLMLSEDPNSCPTVYFSLPRSMRDARQHTMALNQVATTVHPGSMILLALKYLSHFPDYMESCGTGGLPVVSSSKTLPLEYRDVHEGAIVPNTVRFYALIGHRYGGDALLIRTGEQLCFPEAWTMNPAEMETIGGALDPTLLMYRGAMRVVCNLTDISATTLGGRLMSLADTILSPDFVTSIVFKLSWLRLRLPFLFSRSLRPTYTCATNLSDAPQILLDESLLLTSRSFRPLFPETFSDLFNHGTLPSWLPQSPRELATSSYATQRLFIRWWMNQLPSSIERVFDHVVVVTRAFPSTGEGA